MSTADKFLDYVNSVISLDALENMTGEMDKDIAESQKIMDEIKSILGSFSKQSKAQTDSNAGTSRHEDMSNFLEADPPKLLLPDMVESETLAGDQNDILDKIQSHVKELKKDFQEPGPKMEVPSKELSDLELDQYGESLDQFIKQLANLKLSKDDGKTNRDPELEAKLTQLCGDISNFTQMVKAKTKLTEANKSWLEVGQEHKALQYHELITKLRSVISEVTFLLQNKN